MSLICANKIGIYSGNVWVENYFVVAEVREIPWDVYVFWDRETAGSQSLEWTPYLVQMRPAGVPQTWENSYFLSESHCTPTSKVLKVRKKLIWNKEIYLKWWRNELWKLSEIESVVSCFAETLWWGFFLWWKGSLGMTAHFLCCVDTKFSLVRGVKTCTVPYKYPTVWKKRSGNSNNFPAM